MVLCEWELNLYPETCLPLQRELLSFLPAKAMEAYKRGIIGWRLLPPSRNSLVLLKTTTGMLQ